jgi:hypothetical protein
MTTPARRWLGAVEGYYGPPLAHVARLDLVRWMGTQGFTCYGYAPKDDPFHRARWREPYPDDRMAEFAELLHVGEQSGVDVALVVSPGLDWRDDGSDEEALAKKLVSFRDLGAKVLGVAWDDVPPGGADLGRAHGRAIAAAVEAVGEGVDWVTCPTDYSGMPVTPYLRAYADEVPVGVEIMWTGPGIVSPTLAADDLRRFADDLGRPVLFAENFPVNDGAMAGVLHLGPYPERDPEVVDACTGVFCNFMSRPLASRVGLGVAARWWQDPAGDRQAQWREVVDAVPGLRPLAMASRSWVGDGGPDAELAALADGVVAGDEGAADELRSYLFAGCRAGLDDEWQAEVEPWLQQWDFETQAMQYALILLAARPARPAGPAFILSELWSRARASKLQLFGVRWAFYPVTTRRSASDDVDAAPEAVVAGENLTDRLCRAAMGLTS